MTKSFSLEQSAGKTIQISDIKDAADHKYALEQSCIVAVTDPAGIIIHANDNFLKISRYSREELIGQDHRIVNSGFHPKDFILNLWECISNGEKWRGEIKNKAKDGSIYWVDTTIVPSLNEQGKPCQYIAISADITERKKLEVQEGLFKFIVNSSDEGILGKNLDGIVTTWNHGAEKIFGYRPDEIIGMDISILIPDHLQGEESEITKKISRGECINHYKTQRIRKDGKIINVSLTTSPVKDSIGKIIGVSKISRDITEHKAVEEKSIASEERFRNMFDNMPEGVQIHDFKWTYLYVNDALVKYSKYSREELLGHTLVEKYPAIEQTNLFSVLQRCMNERVADQLETEFIFPDGTKAYFELSVQPVPEGLFILSVDKTDQQKTKEKLLKVNRLYAFISAVNKSIVHINDELELLENACNIAVEIGQYKVAWIGLLDEKNRLKVVNIRGDLASSKRTQKYTGMDFSEPGLRGTPIGMALATGKYALSNDVQNDPVMRPWKDEFAEDEIEAVISMPLKKYGKVIGVFDFNSTRKNFFDEEEITLLEEAADDISFALEIFEKATIHKDTEELVIQNEKRFRALIEKSADMKALLTLEGKILFCSASVKKVLGYTVEEVMNKSATDFIHPEDISVFTESSRKISQKPGKSYYFQRQLLHKNGKRIWCEGSVTNMLHEPAVHAFVANFRDISDKKIREKQKEFDRNNLNALINNTKDLMWSVDKDFRLITFNKPFEEICRVVAGKAIKKGSDIFSLGFSAELSIRYREFYMRAFAGEAFTEIEHINTPVDFWSEVSFYPIRKGDEVIGTACHSHDITKRREAAANLGKSEKKYRYLFENNPMPMWVFDLNTFKFLDVNEMAILEYGYSREEFLSMTVLDIRPDADITHFIQSDHSYEINPANHNRGIWNHRKKDGTIIQVEIIAHQIIFEGVRARLILSNDVTEREKAEENLRQSEKRLKESQEIAHLGIWELNFETNVSLWSDEACKIYGFSPQENKQISVNRESFIHPEDLDYVMEANNESRKTLSGTSLNHRIVLKDGTVKHIHSESKFEFDQKGNPVGLYGIALDITERKIAEENLQKSESSLKDAQAIAQLGSWEIDLTNDVHIWSDEMYKIFGLKNGEAIPSTALFSSFVHPEDLNYVNGRIAEAFNTCQDSFFDFRLVRKDGVVRYGYSEWKFQFDKSGKNAIRLYGIIHDVTERKLAEIERAKIFNDLMQRNKDLEQFAYIVSHNLRAPVANILSAGKWLNDPGLNVKRKEVLGQGLIESVTKLDNVIKDLNYILQLKQENNESKEIIRFSKLVDDIKTDIQNLIEGENIAIKYDFLEIDEVLNLRSHLHSIFYNLIFNSIKYRQQQIPCIIEIKSHLKNDRLELIFTDNGMGIDLQRRNEQVFGLYKTFHTDIKGKGMGLFLVKTQVEALGGRISIQSEVNKGTQFIIEFEL